MADAEITYIVVAAAAVTLVAYFLYVFDLVWRETSPNRWSWLIWSAATAMEAMTYQEVSGDWMKSAIFYLSAACCLLVAVSIWMKAKWKWPSITEYICLLASVAAFVLWQYYGKALFAHLLMVFAVPIAFIPTWRGALKDPASEKSMAWALWTVSDLIVLLIIVFRMKDIEELPYATVEFMCHFVTWRLVLRRSTPRGPKNF